jgi:hypothetical protein
MFMRQFALPLLSVISAALVAMTGACTTAGAVTWRFDFTSGRGGGYFEVDATNFVIPTSAGSPVSFNVTGADMDISAGFFGINQVEYTLPNFVQATCTGAECSATFGIKNLQTVLGKYDLYLQLNFEVIWVPWITQDQKTIQMWQHTDPYTISTAWNETGSVQRTVLVDPIAPVPIPAALPLFVSGLGVMGLLGWRRRRKAALQAAACSLAFEPRPRGVLHPS